MFAFQFVDGRADGKQLVILFRGCGKLDFIHIDVMICTAVS